MKVDNTLSQKEIEKEVGKLGFQTSLETRNKDTKKTSKNNEELLKVIASGVLIATGFIGTYTGLPEIISIILFSLALVFSSAHSVKSYFYYLKSCSFNLYLYISSDAIDDTT